MFFAYYSRTFKTVFFPVWHFGGAIYSKLNPRILEMTPPSGYDIREFRRQRFSHGFVVRTPSDLGANGVEIIAGDKLRLHRAWLINANPPVK